MMDTMFDAAELPDEIPEMRRRGCDEEQTEAYKKQFGKDIKFTE